MEEKQTNKAEKNQNQSNQPKQKPNRNKRVSFYWIYAILAVVLIALNFFGRDSVSPTEEINQGKLIELLKAQEVSKIQLVNREDAEIYLNQKGLKKYFPDAKAGTDGTTVAPNYKYKIGSLDRFEETVENAQEGIDHPVYIDNVSRKYWISDVMSWVIPLLLLVLFYVILIRFMGRGMGGGAGSIFNIGKSRAQLYDKENGNVNVTFKDVAGLEEAKVEIMEVVDFPACNTGYWV